MKTEHIMKIDKVIIGLEKIILSLDEEWQQICNEIVTSSRFLAYPAALTKHHVWNGGLAQHTLEVCQFADAACKLAKGRANRNVVLVACIWHDYGKLWDIKWDGAALKWVKTDHYKKVYHVSESYAQWIKESTNFSGRIEREDIGHCILAHHGRIEWGSPVEPQTPEAWIVHHADMNSVFVLHNRKSSPKL